VTFKISRKRYDKDNEKPIFAFDLGTNKFLEEPVLTLDFDVFRQVAGMKISSKSFHISGICIHPLSGYIYMLSNNSKQLLVVNRRGELISLFTLGAKMFRQPEGICFLPNGDMLISSEGSRSGCGYILYFPYNN
jgi:hypothetical protein